MRRLLNTLYVLSENSYLSLKNENIVVTTEDGSSKMFPMLGIESIMTFSYKGASPALIGECSERGISITFLSPAGKFLAMPTGRTNGNVLLRKKQYRISDNEAGSLNCARYFIFGKIYNSRWTLERTVRDHAMRVDSEKLKGISGYLKDVLCTILETNELESLRGIEGKAASSYFSVFNELIINQKSDFVFQSRNRRPPLDRVNAMLSFGYRLLESDCVNALESVGLDSYVGFLHRDRPGRASMALDLMEELRSVLVDRMVLTMINQGQIRKKHFRTLENGAVFLNDDGRKTFISVWQEHKKRQLTHPYLKEKIQWGLVPYTQALLLSRYLREDIEAYPAFLWK